MELFNEEGSDTAHCLITSWLGGLQLLTTLMLRRRARLVDHFNQDASVDVFLLTTKVGGIGINLTGADRCALRPWLISYGSGV